jgi:hypothetical protein
VAEIAFGSGGFTSGSVAESGCERAWASWSRRKRSTKLAFWPGAGGMYVTTVWIDGSKWKV